MRTRRRIRAWLVPAVLVMAMASGAGCDETLDALDDPIANKEAAETARMDVSFRPLSNASDPPLWTTMEATGAIDGGTGLLELEMAIPTARSSTPVDVEVIFDDAFVYVAGPRKDLGIPPDKTWLKMDYPTANRVMKTDLTAFSQAGADSMLEPLGDPPEGAEVIDSDEDVRGVETTHYLFEVDPNQFFDDPAAAERTQENLGSGTLRMELWVGNEDRYLRRMSVQAPNATRAGGIEMTFELFDFNADLTVELPAEEETIDFAEIEQ